MSRPFGAYVLLEELARGGQGSVWRARHEPTGQPVALKLLVAAGEGAAVRFAQEARVLARLGHPNIVGVFDHGDVQGAAFIACELVEGQDLQARVRASLPPPAWSARVLTAVARALQHCHERGVVHRDVKPANVIVERATDRPVLVDFGVIKRDPAQLGITSIDEHGELSLSGSLKGTPEFMAPEQLHPKHGDIGPPTDVYGLGATLYFLLTGQAPFTAESLPALLRKVTRQAPTDPTQLNPAVPQALARLCLHALQKDPRARPPTAEAFASAAQALAVTSEPPRPGLLSGLRGPARAGQRVGPFTVVRELGRGAMGVVFEGRADDGTFVAVKLLSSLGSDERAMKRFQREVQALSTLDHPSVVRFVGASREGTPWLAMELVRGRDLQARLERSDRPTVEESARLVAQIAGAVAHAHERQVMHRDLKPSNVLVRDDDGAAVVTDFGLARSLEASKFTRTGDMVGTLAYMAPEQVRGERTEGPPADVWAIGAILFRCLTGEPPFAADSALGLAGLIAGGGVRRPRTVDATIPRDLEQLCLSCLQRDPDARPSAEQVARTLAAWRPGAVAAPGRRWPAIAIGSIVLASAALAVVASTRKDAAPDPSPGPPPTPTSETAPPPPVPVATEVPVAPVAVPARDARVEPGRALRLTRAQGAPRWVHGGEVPCVAVTPDGRQVLSASSLGSVFVWDVKADEQIGTLDAGDAASVQAVAVSPDGALAVTGNARGTVRLWDLAARRSVSSLPGRQNVTAIAFSADGARVYAGEFEGGVRVIESRGRAELAPLTGAPRNLRGLAVSRDLVAAGGMDGKLTVWDPSRAAPTWTVEVGTAAYGVTFSPDGTLLAAGCQDRVLRVWDVARRQLVHELQGHNGAIFGAAFAGARQVLTASTDHSVRLFDLDRATAVRELIDAPGWALCVAPLPGRRAVSGHRDGVVRRWSLDAPEAEAGSSPRDALSAIGSARGLVLTVERDGTGTLGQRSLGADVRAAVVSPDGRTFTGHADGAVRAWSAAQTESQPTELGSATGQAVRFVGVSADGLRVAWADERGTIRHKREGEPAQEVQGPPAALGAIVMLAFVGDALAQELLVGTPPRLVIIGEARGVDVEGVACGAVTLDGRRAVTGHTDGKLRCWNSIGMELWAVPTSLTDGVAALAISPDGGRGLAVSADGRCVLVDLEAGAALEELDLGPAGDRARSACFADDRRVLVGTELGVVLTFDLKG